MEDNFKYWVINFRFKSCFVKQIIKQISKFNPLLFPLNAAKRSLRDSRLYGWALFELPLMAFRTLKLFPSKICYYFTLLYLDLLMHGNSFLLVYYCENFLWKSTFIFPEFFCFFFEYFIKNGIVMFFKCKKPRKIEKSRDVFWSRSIDKSALSLPFLWKIIRECIG